MLRAVADCDAADAWQLDCLGAVSWLASKTGLVRNAAARLVKTARFVARHPQTAKALDAGDIAVPHVEMLAAAAHRRDDLYDEHETALLDAAATVEVQDFPQVDAPMGIARRRRARAARCRLCVRPAWLHALPYDDRERPQRFPRSRGVGHRRERPRRSAAARGGGRRAHRSAATSGCAGPAL